MTASVLARGLLAGALMLGLLAGCNKGEAPAALPDLTATPTPTPGPTSFTVGGKGYSITFPGRPTHSTEQAKRGLRLTTDVYVLRTEDADFSLSRVSYAGHDAPSLRSALVSAASQTGGRLTSSRTYSYRGQPAIEGTIVGSLKSDREAAVTARYLLVDGKILIGIIYVPNVKPTRATKKVRDAFLDSLQFKTPPKESPAATEDSGDSAGTGPLPG
ncbi:MAG TPA: hypothetical protein VMZ00_07490 [Sporichthya sp.]|nr:hypothetical protein [Sporichthya sp.]